MGEVDKVAAEEERTRTVEEEVKKEAVEEPPSTENKKSKKGKKKNKTGEIATCSSADESKEVEVKQKKKKSKKEKTPEPEPEPEIVEMIECVSEDFVDESNKEKTETEEIFEEFAKEEITYPDDFSPEKDLVEFSESEEKVVEIDDNDDSEKVDFFIREKSSSVESDDLQSSNIDPSAAKPNPWFNKFLQKSSSLIEDQIFGAAKKYEDNLDEKNDDDDDMLELEQNPSDTVYSSDDDGLQFKPVPNKRNKKKQKQKSMEEFDTQDSCPADSESEKVSELEDTRMTKSRSKGSKDGWSFEIDEEDVNKLLESDNIKDASQDTEERTALEDVFRFDSEMTEDDVGEEKPASETLGDKKVSVEDLNDALIDDTEDSEGEGVTIRRRKETSDTDQEDFKECKAASSSCLSSSCADTTDASESSVTNSPNPRQTQKKGKKGKKKKR